MHLRNLFTFMLFLAGTLSIVVFIVDGFYYNLYTGIAFYVVALLNAALEFYQEYRSAILLAGFMKLVPEEVLVRRGGETLKISADSVVRGDLVLFKMGDKIPADLVIIQVLHTKSNQIFTKF